MSFPCSPSEYCAVCISASILPSTLREGTKSKKIAHKRRRRLFFRFLNLKFFALFSAKTCTFETLNHDFETNVPNRLCPPLERYGKRHQWSPNKPKNVKTHTHAYFLTHTTHIPNPVNMFTTMSMKTVAPVRSLLPTRALSSSSRFSLLNFLRTQYSGVGPLASFFGGAR